MCDSTDVPVHCGLVHAEVIHGPLHCQHVMPHRIEVGCLGIVREADAGDYRHAAAHTGVFPER
jgi:hypothetical protein